LTELDKQELLKLEDGGDARLRGFAPAEMVTCKSCLRANPPTRSNCMYCDERLPAREKSDIVRAEAHAMPAEMAGGFYVVLSAPTNELPDESRLEQIASRSGIKPADLQAALAAGKRLPLFKVDTAEQAHQFVVDFRALGVQTTSLKDDDYNSRSAHKKICALEFSSAGVTGLVKISRERLFENWSDLILMVVGRLQTNNVEDVTQRKHGEQKPLDRRELIDDESLVDVYSRSNQEGWRILAGGFDFSCLGERKGITAFENFHALIELFRERAEDMEVENSYLKVRSLLTQVWPLRVETRTGGWRRSGGGKYELSTLTTTDNEAQFTSYSRLMQFLKTREFQNQKPDRQGGLA